MAFAQPVLVIGLGNVGAQIIEGLHRRIDDAFGLPGQASPEGAANRPRFIHITMPQVGGQAGATPYGDNTRRLNTLETEAWEVKLETPPAPPSTHYGAPLPDASEWLNTLTLPPGHLPGSRAAARIILQRDLALNDNSRFMQALKGASTGTQFACAFIIAAADDLVGAQLFGDVAAVMRLKLTGGDTLPIIALTPAYGQERTHADRVTTAETMKVATLIELAALTSSSKLSFPLPNGDRWNNDSSERQLLDGMIFINEPDDRSAVEASEALLWGLITSERQQMLNEVADKVRRPVGSASMASMASVSLAHAREWVLPLRLLRKRRVAQALIRLVGAPGASARINRDGFNLVNPVDITNALDSTRQQGLRAWLMQMQIITGSAFANLITKLNDMAARWNAEITTIDQALRSLIRPNAATGARLIPDSIINGWLAEREVAPALMAQLNQQVGFTATSTTSVMLWATAQHSRPFSVNEPPQLQAGNVETFFRDHIEPLAHRLVAAQGQHEVRNYLRDYFADAAKGRAWLGQFDKWHDDFEGLVREPLHENVRWINYQNAPTLGFGAHAGQMTTFAGAGGAHAVQFALFPRVPVRAVALVSNLAHIHPQRSFVYTMQHLVTDIFSWTNNFLVPYDLQAALTFRQAFVWFARCCRNGTMTASGMTTSTGRLLFPQLENTTPDGYDWKTLLWAFIKVSQDERHAGFLEGQASQPPSSHPVLPPRAKERAYLFYLREAIDKITGDDCPESFNLT